LNPIAVSIAYSLPQAACENGRVRGSAVKFVALGLALSVTACASARAPEVACHGALDTARSYAFVAGGDGAERAEVEAVVSRGLATAGFTPDDRSPDYLVEVLLGERPGGVGAYEKLADPETPDWRVAPAKPSWWRRKQPTRGDVTIRFVDARTGAEAYRATASGRADVGKSAEQAAARFDALATAALEPCPAV